MPNGEATILQLKKRLPSVVNLSQADKKESITRAGEELWEQLVRNIVSHKAAEGNIIAEGLVNRPSRGKLRLTEKGRLHAADR